MEATSPDPGHLTIRALAPEDAPAYVALRRRALIDAPLAFGSSPGDDRASDPEFVRAAIARVGSSAILGAFDGESLVGIAGLVREEKIKERHKAAIYGMFVAEEARGAGLGGALLGALVERARAWDGVLQIHLSVTDAAPEAARLYDRAGFRQWGQEPRALCWEGRFAAERHLVLMLDEG